MKDIYIHIGTHKTGTTTIQDALCHSTKTSITEGWKYLKSPNSTKHFMSAEKYDSVLVNKFKKEINAALRKDKSINRFILSNEALSGQAYNGYLNSEVISSMLSDATKGHNIKIIIYLRRQDDILESIYTQKIHEGETLDFNSFASNFHSPDSLDYNKILGDFEKKFGIKNLYVRSYSQASKEGLLVDFSKTIQSKLLLNLVPKRKNISYSRNALEVARICNLTLNKKAKKQLRKALQKTMPKDKLESFSFFTDTARIHFMKKYKISNNEVAERYFQGNLKLLFPTINTSTSSLEPSSDWITNQQVSELLVELLEKNTKTKNSILKGIKCVLSSKIIQFIYSFLSADSRKA